MAQRHRLLRQLSLFSNHFLALCLKIEVMSTLESVLNVQGLKLSVLKGLKNRIQGQCFYF